MSLTRVQSTMPCVHISFIMWKWPIQIFHRAWSYKLEYSGNEVSEFVFYLYFIMKKIAAKNSLRDVEISAIFWKWLHVYVLWWNFQLISRFFVQSSCQQTGKRVSRLSILRALIWSQSFNVSSVDFTIWWNCKTNFLRNLGFAWRISLDAT